VVFEEIDGDTEQGYCSEKDQQKPRDPLLSKGVKHVRYPAQFFFRSVFHIRNAG